MDDEHKILGKGTQGIVYSTDDPGICVKQFECDEEFECERSALLKLKGIPNICQIHHSNEKNLEIFMTRYDYNLSTLRSMLTYDTRLYLLDQLTEQLFSALDAIKKLGVFHGDIILSNLLCNYRDGNIECFIGDFGASDDEDEADDARAMVYALIFFVDSVVPPWKIREFIMSLDTIKDSTKTTLLIAWE